MRAPPARFLVLLGASWVACDGRATPEMARDAGLEAAAPCASNAQCDDRIPCTRDLCVVGGTCEHLPDNTQCTAPQVCTPGLGCAAPGARRCARPADCDDGVACTRDTCLVDGTCRSTPQDDQCPSGQRCLATGCGTGAPPGSCRTAADCDDRLDCTEDACSASGQCVNVAQNARCGTGRVCRAGMGCVAERPCSSDADCDDRSRCNGVERCSELACVAGTPVSCDDGMACTLDTCVEGDAGMCAHAMDPSCMAMGVRSGLYDIAPRIDYMCRSLLGTPVVVVAVGQLQFSTVGGELTINGANCALVQRPAPTGRVFDARCVIAGSCPEEFRIQGNFVDDRTFNATLSLDFTGNCQALLTDCQPQRWTFRGTLR